MEKDIGAKMRDLRNQRGMTLKDLSAKTGLSVGYLSQAERGVSSIAIYALKSVAEALEVDLSYFFVPPRAHDSEILRSYEQQLFRIDRAKYIYYSLAGNVKDRQIDPMLVAIMPGQTREEIVPYSHVGEEFIYVLEGVLTVIVGDKEYEAYPGDTLHFSSKVPHNWGNLGNHTVKILTVNAPRFLGNAASSHDEPETAVRRNGESDPGQKDEKEQCP